MSKNIPTLVMVGGGIQEAAAVEIVQSSGYRLLTTDMNPDAKAFQKSDFTFCSDGRDIQKIAKYINTNKFDLNIKGIFTLTEMVETVAAVGNLCDLPSVSLKSAGLCQNKIDSKEKWVHDGVPTPDGKIVKCIDEARVFLQNQQKDCFVKPLTGSGGIGASKISSNKELEDYYSLNNPDELLIEEHLQGKMLDLNGCFNEKGEFISLGCFERSFNDDIVIEKSGIYPSSKHIDILNEAKDVTERAAKSLGIKWGPVKSDLIVTSSGVKVFEIAPRLHGPKGTVFLTSISGGTNHLSAILPILIGSSLKDDEIKPPLFFSSFELIMPPNKPFSSIDLNKDFKDVHEVLIFRSSSKNILKYSKSSDAIGYFFSKSKDFASLSIKNHQISKNINFKD